MRTLLCLASLSFSVISGSSQPMISELVASIVSMLGESGVHFAAEEFDYEAESLDLSEQRIEGGFNFLRKFTNLKKLILRSCGTSDISFLEHHPNLRHLELICPDGSADLTPVASLTQLEVLVINVTPEDFSFFATLPRTLVELTTSFSDQSDLLTLQRLTNLKRLTLYHGDARDFTFLLSFPELEHLQIPSFTVGASFAPLLSLPNLKSIVAHSSDPVLFSTLILLGKQLEELNIYELAFDMTPMTALKKLVLGSTKDLHYLLPLVGQLEELALFYDQNSEGSLLRNEFIDFLAKFPGLKTPALDLRVDDFSQLRILPVPGSVKELYMGSSTMQSISGIEMFENLEILDLPPSVTDRSSLLNLKNLKKVDGNPWDAEESGETVVLTLPRTALRAFRPDY